MIITKEDLLDKLDAIRERLLVALEFVPDEALLEPGTVGDWSIADLISMLTAWDAEVITGLMNLKQGKPPQRLLAALADPVAYNVARFAENQDRDLDVIFEDFQGARVHLEEWIEGFNDRALLTKGHYKALGDRSLATVILAATADQEATYLPALDDLGRAWARTEDTVGPTVIPLLGIETLGTSGNGHNPE